MENHNNEFDALLRASCLYHYYKSKASRMIEVFWTKVQNAESPKEIHFICDLLMIKLGGKVGLKYVQQRRFTIRRKDG